MKKFIPVLLLGLLIGGIMWSRLNGWNSTQAQFECSGRSPEGSAINFGSLTNPENAKVSEAEAIQVARENAAVSIDSPEIKTIAQYVLFSDDARGTANEIGDDDSVKLDFQKVPSWVITFCGATVPISVPFGMRDKVSPNAATHEWNVVVNAETGEYMEEFSFQ